MDVLGAALSNDTLKQMANQVGAPEDRVQSAIGMAIRALLQGLERNASNPQEATALVSALRKDHDGSLLDNLGGFLNSFQQGPGAGILGHVWAEWPKPRAPTQVVWQGCCRKFWGATGQIQQQQPQASNLINMLLDQNRDGNVVDDVVRMMGNFLR